MTWRVPGRFTHPWGLKEALERRNYTVGIPYLHGHSDSVKLDFLDNYLSSGYALIILGGSSQNFYKHYVTLLGYQKTSTGESEYFLYDSLAPIDQSNPLLTIDGNGGDPGNVTWSELQLLTFWRHGHVMGQYRWYVQAVNKNDAETRRL